MQRIARSLRQNRWGIILILFSAASLASGQLCWKLSGVHLNALFILGVVIYVIGALCMLLAYRYGNLSLLHPLISTSYVIAYILGFFVLGEQISTLMIAGLVIIVIGNILITAGDVH